MGGLKYLFNVAYGIGKAGCDRMAADCGHELRKTGVAMVSLWPGAVKTEYIQVRTSFDLMCRKPRPFLYARVAYY